MKTTKIILDRPIISSEEIEKKQEFHKIVRGIIVRKPGALKNPWFYGFVAAISMITFMVINEFVNTDSSIKDKPTSQARGAAIEKFDLNAKKDENISFKSGLDAWADPTNKEVEKSQMKEVDILVSKYEDVEGLTTLPKKLIPIVKKPLTVPNIGGVHSGAMKASELMKYSVIESGTTEPIKSFMIGYFNGTTDVLEYVTGNELSEKLKNNIIEFNTGEMIFFTEMYVNESDGKLVMLSPINLRILPN